ncbi:MAG: BamA/TamA family outer membrane protein [Flammeovirgaceae bacterium]|nr:BamA/TamA family outer membrane protein [Flammeovirgaceae bacterium]
MIRKTFIYLILLTPFYQSCVPTSNLSENEYLLYTQKIKKNKAVENEELEVFYRQKPNRKLIYLPIMPYLYAYYVGKRSYENRVEKDVKKIKKITIKYENRIDELKGKIGELAADSSNYLKPKKLNRDTLQIQTKVRKLRQKLSEKVEKINNRIDNGNFFMRTIGEPPAIYDSTATQITLSQMNRYLKYRGYFDGYVTTRLDTAEKLITLTYLVKENDPYRIKEKKYQIPDSAIYEIIKNDSANSLIKKEDIFNEGKVEEERKRLSRLLKDKGYFEFNPSYIFFRVNDTITDKKVNLNLIVKNPPKGRNHTVYGISEVTFESDVDINTSIIKKESNFKEIKYLEGENHYSKKVLDNKILVRPENEVFKQSDTENTQISLANMDIFKFVNIHYDTVGNALNAHIFTSPLKKYQYSFEGGLNVSQALPGPFVSFSFKDRNIFGGLDIFEFNARAAIDVQAGATSQQNISSQEFGANFVLTFPQILFPSKKIHNNRNLLAPKTKLQSGFGYVNRPEYTRANVQGIWSYNWLNKKKALFNLSLVNVSVINTIRIDSVFKQQLDSLFNRGSTLINSFDSSFVSSIDASYVKSVDAFNIQSRKTKYFRAFIELGGTMMNLFDNASFIDQEKVFGLRYFKFVKGLVDFRQGYPIGKNGQVAARLSMGFAKPYGSTDALPYEKYFFSGGSNSNRAWPARRIGPGSFTPTLLPDGQFDYSFEQPGEIILESNFEVRRPLFGFFDGALFVDASNVWTFKDEPNRPGGQFTLRDFWKEIAVGAGGGIRLNFDFLLIRFDLGIKMYDPAREKGNRLIINKLSFKNPLGEPGQYTFNLGIGYPF